MFRPAGRAKGFGRPKPFAIPNRPRKVGLRLPRSGLIFLGSSQARVPARCDSIARPVRLTPNIIPALSDLEGD
jgi:hypothetical protein